MNRSVLGIAAVYSFDFLDNRMDGVLILDNGKHLPTKLRALEEYAEEMRAPPHSHSLEHVLALARHRGYSAGLDAVEAFMAYRMIRR